VEPFVAACRRHGGGIFCLVKTSNSGAADVQDLVLSDGRRVWQHVARLVAEWGAELVGERGLSSVGAVVGATHPRAVAEARRLIAGRASLLAKIEKPAAIERLDGILELADAVMVARGDLGVEMLPEEVPPLQKRIVESARLMGRPVVVATQMLESMITSPSPTRAEVSDVATAVYDGADAIMLSAESASGQYPIEAVAMMNRIATSVEADPSHGERVHCTETPADPTTNDAIAEAANKIVGTVSAGAIVCFTVSGSTARRVSRERPAVPLLVLTPSIKTARGLGRLWGAQAVRTREGSSFEEMIGKAKRMALRHGLAKAGDRVVITAGVPFGTPGSTNVVHVARLVGDELDKHKKNEA